MAIGLAADKIHIATRKGIRYILLIRQSPIISRTWICKVAY